MHFTGGGRGKGKVDAISGWEGGEGRSGCNSGTFQKRFLRGVAGGSARTRGCPFNQGSHSPPTQFNTNSRTFMSALTSATVVGRDTSNTQSVMLLLVSGTRTARPFSLPWGDNRQGRMLNHALPIPRGSHSGLLLLLLGIVVSGPLAAAKHTISTDDLYLLLALPRAVGKVDQTWHATPSFLSDRGAGSLLPTYGTGRRAPPSTNQAEASPYLAPSSLIRPGKRPPPQPSSPSTP